MMAMDNYFLFPPWDCDWDSHTFGSAGDLHQQLVPLATTESPASSSQASTGYLQDAVAGWSSRSKRRRLASSPSHLHCSAPLTTGDLRDILQGFLDSSYLGDPLLDQRRMLIEPGSSSPCGKSLRCSKELQQKDIQDPISKAKALTLKGASERRGRSEKKSMAYPFAVVKPSGMDGGVTLDDINAQLLKRPRRPVRHPVGEFAAGPRVVSPAGPGLSGKAVVSLTRIQTQGRGTITIIRTKG
ncbi:protein XRI1-like [Curcuma longa]|uniref:protein XRI1-like n=1 Tax=Curcuma longa TaxID=136217 RepID=UPI003D9E38F5